MVLGIAIAIQSGLEFLGIGDAQTPTWGSMLKDAFDSMYRRPVNMLWPALAIGLATVALTLLANVMRDELGTPSPGCGSPGRARRPPRYRAPEAVAAISHEATSARPPGGARCCSGLRPAGRLRPADGGASSRSSTAST